jgi:hypothetical protein
MGRTRHASVAPQFLIGLRKDSTIRICPIISRYVRVAPPPGASSLMLHKDALKGTEGTEGILSWWRSMLPPAQD